MEVGSVKKVTYLAVFEPGEEGYSVYFPDLPGCVSYGDTFELARQGASEALGLHLYGMEKDGERIPPPSDRPAIDPETAAGYLVSPVTVFPELTRNELDNRRVKTNVTISAWLKEEAEKRQANYSRILENALMEYLDIPYRRA